LSRCRWFSGEHANSLETILPGAVTSGADVTLGDLSVSEAADVLMPLLGPLVSEARRGATLKHKLMNAVEVGDVAAAERLLLKTRRDAPNERVIDVVHDES
jgi:hypothetical protein